FVLAQQVVMDFRFKIFRVGLGDIEIDVIPIGDFGFQDFGVAKDETGLVILDEQAVGVAVRIGGVVVGGVIVDGPAEELEMAIGADGVGVEKIHHAEFAEA